MKSVLTFIFLVHNPNEKKMGSENDRFGWMRLTTVLLTLFCRQFTDRLLLFFMPNKYQPDHSYLRRMPIGRVHLFTGIQGSILRNLISTENFSNEYLSLNFAPLFHP
jgi:hypothetical protein